jgi:hypothetical protein
MDTQAPRAVVSGAVMVPINPSTRRPGSAIRAAPPRARDHRRRVST